MSLKCIVSIELQGFNLLHLSLLGPFSLLYFGFLCLQVSSVSNFLPDTRGQKWPFIHVHSFSCAVEREGHCKKKKISLACVGSAHSRWTTWGFPQGKTTYTSQVHTAQAPGCFAIALSQVGPVFHALPRSKLLRFSGALQGHRPRWAVSFVPFPGPTHSGDWVPGEHPGGP